MNQTNITGCFLCERINQLRTKTNHNTRSIVFGIESTMKSICQTLNYWKYQSINQMRLVISVRITRNTLNLSSDCIVTGLLCSASALTEYEIINLKPIKSMFNGFNEHLDCRDNVKCRIIQLISPHLRSDRLKQFWIDINVNIHKRNNSDYE